jgi:hypothetical protein
MLALVQADPELSAISDSAEAQPRRQRQSAISWSYSMCFDFAF